VSVVEDESVANLAVKLATLGPSTPYFAFSSRWLKRKGRYRVANQPSRDQDLTLISRAYLTRLGVAPGRDCPYQVRKDETINFLKSMAYENCPDGGRL
jgi:hypothetical protein